MKYIKHILGLAIYYFVFVAVGFFLSPYLVSKGISNDQIGYIYSFGLVMLILSTILNGYLADKYFSNRKVLIVNVLIGIVSFITMLLTSVNIILVICYLLIWATIMMIAPIVDGLILKDVPDNRYAFVRGFGSLGAAISYFVNSYMLGNSSYSVVISICIAMLIILIIDLYLIKEQEFSISVEYKKGIKELKTNRTLMLIMIITFLSYGVLSADDPYNYQYNTQVVGITAGVVGFVGLLSIGSEAVFMWVYDRINDKIGFKKALYIAICTLAVIFFTKRFMYNMPFIINLGNVVMGVYTGLFIPAAVMLIHKYSDGSVKNTMLGLYNISNRLGGLVLSFLTAVYFSMTGEIQDIYLLHMIIIIISLFFVAKLDVE